MSRCYTSLEENLESKRMLIKKSQFELKVIDKLIYHKRNQRSLAKEYNKLERLV